MTRVEKIGAWTAAILSCLALCTVAVSPVMALIDARYATAESVDTKIAVGIADIRADLNNWRKDDTEFWIQFLDFKANRGEANDFDMVLLESKLRLRDELLKKPN